MRWSGVFAVLGGIAACADTSTSGPFDGLPLDGVFAVGVGKPVHVARDRDGVAHIAAATMADAAFVQGYVMAHDRLPQMDVLRRFGAGTLAELYGTLDPAVIDSDLEMRMHRMKPLAQDTWTVLQASSDPIDQRVVQQLAQFADGVNAYARDLQQGTWSVDPSFGDSVDPAHFVAWSPVDSLVIERFNAFALSYSAPFEITATELYQKLRTTYDLAAGITPASARHGVSRDLMKFMPVSKYSTIPGFPNAPSDAGVRSEASNGPCCAAIAPSRPMVPQQVFDEARAFFASAQGMGPHGALGAHAFSHAFAGSNSWVVGARIAGGSRVMLATDQHGPLSNPMMFYPTHLMVADGGMDLLGVTLPGVPGVVSGSNGKLAWTAAVGDHDVNDVYLEQIAPCETGGGDCVAWVDPQGVAQSVPIQTFTEDIQIGTLGTITGHQLASYEFVPHHGPIVPAIDRTRHQLVPRTGAVALSIAYTGYRPTFEVRAREQLGHATSVTDGFRALQDVTYGSQDWMMIDTGLHIGWTAQAYLPVRKPAAYAWDPLVRQDDLAPFFVLPGNGDGDWLADHPLPPQLVPHAIDPPTDYLVSANADPVGATFDGLPLNQGMVDGEPLYVGVGYAAGLRAERIARLIAPFDGSQAGMTLDDMAAIQGDTHSSVGERLTPAILTALARLDQPQVLPPDVQPYLDALPPADRARLATARARLAGWTYATPAATDAPDGDSGATAIFHTWMHFFIERALKDEFDAIDFDVWRLDDDQLVRIVHAMLADPRSLVTSPATQQPILCDNYATSGPDDSCTKVILQAMVDAMTYLESPLGYATADPAAWRWGKLHQLMIPPLLPDPGLTLPAESGGFPRAGDNFAISRSDRGWRSVGVSRSAGGPVERILAEATLDVVTGKPAIAMKWAFPGGVIFDSRSPHDRDLLDRTYLTNHYAGAPYSIDQIVLAGEARWVFH